MSGLIQGIKCVCIWLLQVPVHVVQLDMRDLDAVKQLPEQLPEEFKQVGSVAGGCPCRLLHG